MTSGVRARLPSRPMDADRAYAFAERYLELWEQFRGPGLLGQVRHYLALYDTLRRQEMTITWRPPSSDRLRAVRT